MTNDTNFYIQSYTHIYMIPHWASRSNVHDFTIVNEYTNQDTLRLAEVFVVSSLAPALYLMDLTVLILIGSFFRRHNLTIDTLQYY